MGVAVSKEGMQKQVTDIGRAKIAVEKMKEKAAASSPPSAKANDEAENQNTSQELLVKPAKQEVEVDPSSAAWVKISVWQKFTRKFQRSEHKKRTVATKVTEAEDEEATRRFRNKALFRPTGPDFGQINPLSPLRYDYFLPPPTEEEEECSFCHMLLYDTLHRCRVCAKYYHSKCLYTHTGVGQDSASKAALALSDGDIGWSCPSCENLGDLLTEDEMMLIMDKFESLDVDQDTTISEDEYVSYHKKKHREMFGEDLPPKEEATCCERGTQIIKRYPTSIENKRKFNKDKQANSKHDLQSKV
ncbi:PHD finger protein 24-like [Ptychodera flava]|uniref:PHD finger protein 24-like n=1 Tax=Ptychodera flava TaxID=63121 RepID=UPI00396A3850